MYEQDKVNCSSWRGIAVGEAGPNDTIPCLQCIHRRVKLTCCTINKILRSNPLES